MRFSTLIPLLLAAGVVQAQQGGKGKGQGKNNGQQAAQQQAAQQQAAQQAAAQNNGGQNNAGQNNGGQNNGGQNNALCLNQANVQTGSQNDGLADAEPGQAASAVDQANFINFCSGKTITNGLQVKGGSCNGIVMGDIPASSNMVSAVFTNPKNNDVIKAGDDITFSVQVANLNAGSFTNPDNTYYAAPQAVNGGNIVGHTHITCQFLGANNDSPEQPLNAENFDFFKGINDDGNGQGLLSATLANGLPKVGFYRVCSMTSSSNHQPVIMPVAQRGPQDDCVRFQVTADGQAANNGQAQQGQNNGQAQAGQGQAQAGQGQAQAGQGQAQAGQGQAQAGQGQAQAGQGQAQAGQGQAQAGQGQAQQGKGKGQGQAQAGQGQAQAGQGQAQAGQGQAQAGQGQAQQGQQEQNQPQLGNNGQANNSTGQGQQAQGQGQQGGGRRGRGRFGRPKFQARDFIA